MIKTILALLSGAVEAWNSYQQKKRDQKIEDTGRKLQNIDTMSATVKDAVDARKSDAEVEGLSDDDLAVELGGVRREPKA